MDQRLIATGAKLGLVKNVATGGFYSVSVPGGITVQRKGGGGKVPSLPVAGLDGHAAILDTGTNVLLLPDQAFASLRERYQVLCNGEWRRRGSLLGKQKDVL